MVLQRLELRIINRDDLNERARIKIQEDIDDMFEHNGFMVII